MTDTMLDQAAATRPVPSDRLAAAAGHARAMLAALGIACDDESTAATPERFVRALAEMTAGRLVDPDRHLLVTFPPESPAPGLIVVTGIPFQSVCEHHLLPFSGRAAVAYLPAPGSRIVGLSKLARVVQEYAARPQVQERLCTQVVGAVTSRLRTDGAACLIRSVHSCMTVRGARAHGGEMVTTQYAGVFERDAGLRAEFLAMAAGGAGPAGGGLPDVPPGPPASLAP